MAKPNNPGGLTTHGLSRHPLYKTHVNMMQRCYNPLYPRYKDYGGRGIGVDAPLHCVVEFIRAVELTLGPRPKDHTLDRVENNLGYCLSNLQWANRKDQNRNKRTTRTLTLNGVTKSWAEWGDRLGIARHVVDNRWRRGWSDERILTTPVGRPGRPKKG